MATRDRREVMFGYSPTYLIDTANAVIVDVKAMPTRITSGPDDGTRCSFGYSAASDVTAPCAP